MGKQVEKSKNGTYFQKKNNIGSAKYQSRYAITEPVLFGSMVGLFNRAFGLKHLVCPLSGWI
jgi:hypothetical protein